MAGKLPIPERQRVSILPVASTNRTLLPSSLGHHSKQPLRLPSNIDASVKLATSHTKHTRTKEQDQQNLQLMLAAMIYRGTQPATSTTSQKEKPWSSTMQYALNFNNGDHHGVTPALA